MPELPEVEVSRRSIDPPLRGQRVLSARTGKELRRPLGRDPQALQGLTVGPLARRGKYLWLPLLAPGDCDVRRAQGLLLHLGMSGSLAVLHPAPPPGPHDHFDLETTGGTLRLTDPRRFGAVVWAPGFELEPAATMLAGLGIEPFDPALTPEAFHAALQRRRASIKSVLLAGDVVVGAGNIYACEALFRAGIDPRLAACRISRTRAARLLAELRAILAMAMDLGGSTLRNFRDAHGVSGAFQSHAAVYGRSGQRCLRCPATVRRIVQQQRSTYFCGGCQRR